MGLRRFISVILAGLALLTQTGCFDKQRDLDQTKMVELSIENERLTAELQTVTEGLQQLQAAQMGFISQQIVSQPVRFQGGGDTLREVIDRKTLRCGGNADLPGFGFLDPDSSEFIGFDIDICRAIGAAILGEQGASQIQVTPLTTKLRFASLQAGEVDVLTRNTTWTMSRDTELRTNYAGVTYFDGQGVLVRIKDEILKMSDLRGKSVCVVASSTSATNIKDYFANVGIPVEIREFDDRISALKQYDDGACDAYTGDKSSLIAQRTLLGIASSHAILFDEISREPLGPMVRHGDDNWLDVITWTIQCLFNGEHLGISQDNIDELRTDDESYFNRVLGIESELGRSIGIADDFCYQIIKQVGNYKDIYDRHLGQDTLFNLPRGLNALYTDGGLHYPLPLK